MKVVFWISAALLAWAQIGYGLFLAAVRRLGAPAFTPYLEPKHATRLAEWVARITLSYLCSPSEHVSVFDEDQVRSMVDDFVLPGFTKLVGSLEGMRQ